ncbi:MAG: hypothetical protein EZS28_017999 [Streblomastix strix]|uniref:Uncharacterized protein n=1 Tax=Streblomastix strix TaxID=222440 RepID=A0A5J4VUT1_9EUKA|nr:MAG: hypothetical protein EZS28_017999 [Streblomastix strix]
MVQNLQKRSVCAESCMRIVGTVASLILLCVITHPGQVTLAARDFYVNTRSVYDICNIWCRGAQYVKGHTKLPSYLTEENQKQVTDKIKEDLHRKCKITQINIRDRLTNARTSEIALALNRS